MDNHESPCALDAILYAKKWHSFSSLPSTLSPLVMGPFKAKLWVAKYDQMSANPGRTITINNLASLTSTAYQASFTENNILAAFCITSIWQFSRLAFSDEDFQTSYFTDRNFLSGA
jgi:hypothetical protein